MTSSSVEVMPKRLELARELLPSATIIPVLVNPTNAAVETQLRDLLAVNLKAARALGISLPPEIVLAPTRLSSKLLLHEDPVAVA